MTATILGNEITIGDNFYKQFNTTYDADDYTVYLKLRGGCDIDLTAGGSGETHTFDVSASTTVDWIAGFYKYVIYAEKQSGSPTVIDSYTIESGSVNLVNRADQLTSGTDLRSFYKITLDNLQAVIQNKARKDQLSYSIAGRSLSKMTWEELLSAHDRFDQAYKKELNKTSSKRNKIKFHMG